MRKLMIAAAVVTTASGTPALAHDGAAYVGVDVGLMSPRSMKIRLTNSNGSFEDAIRLRHQLGIDADALFGYDFGMFRVEGEFGYKQASTKDAQLSPTALHNYDSLNTATFYQADGSTRALSAMLNALIDLGASDTVNFSVGAGVGVANIRTRAGLLGNTTLNFTSTNESAIAWQLLAQVRAPVSNQIDLGIKARYFETGGITYGPFCRTTCSPDGSRAQRASTR